MQSSIQIKPPDANHWTAFMRKEESIMEQFSSLPIEKLLRAEGYDCDCGKHHTVRLKKVIIGQGALFQVGSVLRELGVTHPMIVADQNTYRVAGRQVYDLLTGAGVKCELFVFPQAHVEPSEFSVGQVIMKFVPGVDCMLAVGSGTINDICKMVSKATGTRQVVVGTAPSMDGYASNSSSMISGGVKVTIYSVCPDAIIADVDVLRQAPLKMLQAGLGDMLAKYISVCEWRISHIVTGEYYCEEVAALMRRCVHRIVEAAPQLTQRSPQAVMQVVEGLIISGIAMSYAEVSRPASGLEHYFSHIWEMHSLMGRCPGELHGIQVGVGTVLTLRLFNWLRNEKPDRERALKHASEFDMTAWEREMRDVFGPTADAVIEIERSVGKHDPVKYAARLERIIDNWDEILRIIDEELPDYSKIVNLMKMLQEPTMPRTLGLSDGEVITALKCSQEIRDKYILSRLLWDLGILDEYADRLRNSLAISD